MSQVNATGEPPNYYMNMAGDTLNVYSTGRLCLNCNCWVTGYHDCSSWTLTPQSSTSLWKCGGCGQWVSGAFHSCVPVTYFAPQPERKPHVCPVCEGEKDDKECRACKGACVLWG